MGQGLGQGRFWRRLGRAGSLGKSSFQRSLEFKNCVAINKDKGLVYEENYYAFYKVRSAWRNNPTRVF